jgi:hypothetical protein
VVETTSFWFPPPLSAVIWQRYLYHKKKKSAKFRKSFVFAKNKNSFIFVPPNFNTVRKLQCIVQKLKSYLKYISLMHIKAYLHGLGEKVNDISVNE